MGLYKSKYHLITYPLLRIELANGETEVLMSNLLSEAFTLEDFADLYRRRWGIETCFDYLKNIFKAPVFRGPPPRRVFCFSLSAGSLGYCHCL